jgi:parvulin-like peptidyl-prolyl isomerase
VKGQTTKKFSDYPAWFRKIVIDFEVRIEVLSDRAGTSTDNVAAAKAFYDQNKDTQFTNWCLDVLFTTSQDSATAARARVTGGEDFNTVAKDVAAQAGQPAAGNNADGDAGCDSPTSWQSKIGPELTTAISKLAAGEMTEPVEVQPGTFLVVKLRSDAPQPFEEVRAQLEYQVAQQELNVRIGKRLAALKIEVNPKYGTWTSEGGQFKVVPPAGAEHSAKLPAGPTLLGGADTQAPPPPPG